MKFRSAKTTLILLSAALISGSCSILDTRQDNAAGTSFIQLLSAVETFMDESSYPVPQNPEDFSQWVEFFDFGERQLTEVQEKLSDWKTEVGKLQAEGQLGASEIQQFRDLQQDFDEWVAGLADQASMSRSCMLEDLNPFRCLSELTTTKADDWAASQLRLTASIENWIAPAAPSTTVRSTTTSKTQVVVPRTVPTSPSYTVPPAPTYTLPPIPAYTIPPLPTYTLPPLPTYTVPPIAAPAPRRIGAICRDGWRSSATGSGACSWHGGVARWLYSG